MPCSFNVQTQKTFHISTTNQPTFSRFFFLFTTTASPQPYYSLATLYIKPPIDHPPIVSSFRPDTFQGPGRPALSADGRYACRLRRCKWEARQSLPGNQALDLPTRPPEEQICRSCQGKEEIGFHVDFRMLPTHGSNNPQGNGGEVVSLEKNADMLIADNIKRAGLSPPDGSYCWKWIDTSVKNGFLEEKSDYLIKTEARLVGASQPAKSHRNAFSKTEDLILLKWVSTNDMEVGGMTVRELFDELARTVSLTAHISYAYFAVAVAADNSKYPQHTSQSWYNRWTKHLRDRPRPSEVTDELEQVREITSPNRPLTRQAAIAHVPAHTTGSARHVQPTNEAGPRQAPPSSSPLRRAPEPSTPTPRKRPAPRGRNAFTAEEDQMLLAYVQDMKKLLKPTSGNTIYKDFASHVSRSLPLCCCHLEPG